MKLLFVTERVPFPLHSGDSILSWHTLDHLCEHHEVHLVAYPALADGDDGLGTRISETVLVPAGASSGKRYRQLGSLLTTRGAIETVCFDSRFRDAVARQLAAHTYDAIIVDHLRMGWLVPTVLSGRGHAKVVFRSHNCEADVRRLYVAHARNRPTSLALRWEWRKTCAYEERTVRAVDAVIAVTHEDALLHLAQGAAKVVTVPPGFNPDGATGVPHESEKIPRSVVLMGSFGYFAKEINALYLLQRVFPQIRARVPDAKLLLVGAGPSARLLRAAAATEGVTVTGRVADARATAKRCEVFIMPTIVGGGFELKGLEAVGLRLPIVATPLACRGLELEPNKSILIGATAEELAAHAVRLLCDGEARRQQGEVALSQASPRYCWSAVNRQFEAAVTGMVSVRM